MNFRKLSEEKPATGQECLITFFNGATESWGKKRRWQVYTFNDGYLWDYDFPTEEHNGPIYWIPVSELPAPLEQLP